jgi:hypothetical protein
MDDLWWLDLAHMRWHELQPAGEKPHARCSTAAAVLDAGRGSDAAARVLYVGGAFYGAGGGLEMLGDARVLTLRQDGGSCPAAAWSTPTVAGTGSSGGGSSSAGGGGAAPQGGGVGGISARNASVLLPLPLGREEGAGSSPQRLLLYGGWRAFVESYNDTFIIQEVAAE